MKIENGKISNGLEDITNYLGLNHKKVIYMHSTSFDTTTKEGRKRATVISGRMLFAEILSYSSNERNGVKSAITYFNQELLKYLQECNMLKLENVIQVGEERKVEYPYNSVSFMLNTRIKENEKLRKELQGYTIVSSYISKEDEEIAQLINGQVLMSAEEQVKFNSKYYFRKLAENYDYSIIPGVAFLGLNSLNENLDKMKRKVKDSSEEKMVWIKLESQTAGTGNILISLNDCTKEIESKINAIASKIYDDQYIQEEMPLIIELDVNEIENEREIENIGVEAVITKDKITMLGGVSQKIQNGNYIGSIITKSTYQYIDKAQKVAEEACVAYAEAGYQGFITIDVLMTKNKETNEIKGYNIDPNARFSAGTMLLRGVHLAEEKEGKRMYGISFSTGVPNKEKIVDLIIEAAGEELYKGEKSHYQGIIPLLINDVTILKDGKYYLKTAVVADSYEKALAIYNQFKKKLRGEIE